MNTRINFSSIKLFTLALTGLLSNAFINAQQNQQAPATSFSVYSNLTTLGSDGTGVNPTDVSFLNTRLTALATSAQAVAIEGPGFATAADTSLAALAGTGNVGGNADATHSGSTNTFNPLTNSLADMCGAGFDTTNNSLVTMTTALDDIEGVNQYFLTANNSLAAICGTADGDGSGNGSGSTNIFNPLTNSLADMCGASFDTTKNSLSVISGGNTFVTATDNLHAIATVLATMQTQAALTQVISAASNTALTCALTGATNAATFNSAMNTVFSSLATAQAAPDNANITTVQTNITTALAVNITTGTTSSPYAYQVVTAALQQLEVAVNNWIAFYPA